MAVSFNGSSDSYDMGNQPTLHVADNGPITLCCWINFSSFQSGATMTFVAGGFNGTATSYQFQVGGGTFGWTSFNNPTVHGIQAWPYTWLINQWHHVLGTYDGTVWNLYSDGALVAGPTTDHGPYLAGRDFTVGAVDANGTASQFTSACMADVAIFNGPLNGTEITGLGNGSLRPNTGMSKTLLGYWPLNTGGTTTPDSSGNNFTGNQVTTTPGTCASSPPFGGIVMMPASLRLT